MNANDVERAQRFLHQLKRLADMKGKMVTAEKTTVLLKFQYADAQKPDIEDVPLTPASIMASINQRMEVIKQELTLLGVENIDEFGGPECGAKS